MIQKGSEKSSDNYNCIYCNYTTSRKSQFERHLTTRKHKNRQNDTNDISISSINFECKCGKKYTHKQNLYRHQKKCKYMDNDNNCTIIAPEVTNDLILKLVQENSEIKSMLFKQFESIQEQQKFVQTENKELRSQISELIPRLGNNNTVTNKQKFNINIFLNEQCKDALTMEQFIDNIQVTMSNLLLTKTMGIDEGISNIFIENMNKLSINERPMHCTDTKRDTIYIKSDGDNGDDTQWTKDTDRDKIKKAIKKIESKQHKNLGLWIEEHPDWETNELLQEEYLNLMRSCTRDVKDQKIIKNLCNAVKID